MAGTTISTATTVGIRLSAASQNPLTVTSTGTISVTGAYITAIQGSLGLFATIANSGLVASAGGYGINLLGGGAVFNGAIGATGAIIEGHNGGLRFGARGAATLSNFGTIASTGTVRGAGVAALGGGSIINGATNDLVATITGNDQGVRIGGPLAHLNNFGHIAATGASLTVGFASAGALLTAGGTVVNGGGSDTSASITGVTWGVDVAHAAGTVTNAGTISGSGPLGHGVYLLEGGSVTNGSGTDAAAYILGAGRDGIYAGGLGASSVTNYAGIKGGRAGVFLQAGGTLVNTASGKIAGSIWGVYVNGATESVSNNGQIVGTQASGVDLYLGGAVTNGAATIFTASISGSCGIYASGFATISNFATVTGTANAAVTLTAGGNVFNGTTGDGAAVLSGVSAVYAAVAGTITNFGKLTGTTQPALLLRAGGSVSNGNAALVRATITSTSNSAIYAGGPANVTNFGTIVAPGRDGTEMTGGGTLVNGGTGSTAALISGGNGVLIGGTGASITNFAKIAATGTSGSQGVDMLNGGQLVNGSATDTLASITGIYGAVIRGSATVTNSATIAASTGVGLYLFAGGSIVNGSTADHAATIKGGGAGINVGGGATTVTNYGTINGGTGLSFSQATGAGATGTVINYGTITNPAGTAGLALQFGTGANRLIEEPGSVLVGFAIGGPISNTLELAAGTTAGSITGIGRVYTHFSALAADTGGNWSITGTTNFIPTLTANGTVTVSGSLDVNTSLDPASTGAVDIAASSTLEVATVVGKGPAISFVSGADLRIDSAALFGTNPGLTSYVGPTLENFIAGATIDLLSVSSTGLVATYATASGELILSNGGGAVASLQFQNATLGSGTFHIVRDSGSGTLLTHS